MKRNRTFTVAAMIACALVSITPCAPAQTAESIVQKMHDTYAALKSYSDTGVILDEYGSSSADRHTFTTNFNRAPRHFLLDFRKQSGDRFVVWGDPDAFHTWGKTTGQQYDYPNPNNVAAISMSGYNTKDSVLKVPPLLYSKAALGGFFNNFADPVLDGTEDIGGRRCYRVVGRVSDMYAATGKEVNLRKVTLWIDSESFLLRQVREEWKTVPGNRSRLITTLQPQANPTLDDSKFKFVAPQQ